MRSKLVPALIGSLVLAGVLIALAIHYRSAPDSTEETSAPTETASTPPTEAVPTASTEGVPTSNPHPDLSVDGDGLSKAVATIKTAKGIIRFKFYPEDAPKTVARIVELVGERFYNGLVFHRVVPNFVIQGGDPQGNGTGGSGKRLHSEFNKRQHRAGTLAMARSADPDSADSQFYITITPQPQLDGQYTVFGQVIEGMDVVEKVRPGDRMIAVYVEMPEAQAEAPAPTESAPAAKTPAADHNHDS